MRSPVDSAVVPLEANFRRLGMSRSADMSATRGETRRHNRNRLRLLHLLTPLLLLGLLTPLLLGAEPVRALEEPNDRSFSLSHLPPELAAPSTMLPIDLILALEDGAWQSAEFHLKRALDDTPDEPGLRALRQALAASRQPDDFLKKELPLPADAAPFADRYEAAHHQVLRMEIERGFYRGDREPADAFIGRLEDRAKAIDATLSGLARERPTSPWVLLTQAWLHRLQHTLAREEMDTLWQLIDETGGHWRRYLRLLALEKELAGSTAWLELDLAMVLAARDPLAGKVQLMLLDRQARELPSEQAIARYVAADASFPDGAWRDDFELAWGRMLSRAYTLDERKQALVHLEPLTHPPFRNTTVAASGEYGHLLRRMRLWPRSIAFYDSFHQAFPSERYRFDREIGLALYGAGQYEKAVGAFRKSAESPRGNGRDYLYIAESMRFLPGASPLDGASTGVREEALKLTDFASAAMVQEILVRGWKEGRPPQVTLLRARLSELEVLSRHALLYPLTFLTIGLQALLELIAVGLGLIVFVSYPRISRRLWRSALGVAALGVLFPVVALGTALPVTMGGAGNLAWVGQAGVRIFFLLVGAAVLSPVVGIRGLELFRALRRDWRRGEPRAWLATLTPVLLCAAGLMLAGWITSQGGRAPTVYLARLPTVLAGGELGAVSGDLDALGRVPLELYHILRTELLARGFLLAVLIFLLRRYRLAPWIAVVGGAVLWTLLTAGSMEPAPVQMAMGMVEGLMLGWLRLKRGIDGAVAAHALAALVM